VTQEVYEVLVTGESTLTDVAGTLEAPVFSGPCSTAGVGLFPA
jgi:hypothetical protein